MRQINLLFVLLLITGIGWAQFPDPLVRSSIKDIETDLPRLANYVQQDPAQVVVRGDLVVAVSQLRAMMKSKGQSAVSSNDINRRLRALERSLATQKEPTPALVNEEIGTLLEEFKGQLPLLLSGTNTIKNLNARVEALEYNGDPEPEPKDKKILTVADPQISKQLEKKLAAQTQQIYRIEKLLRTYAAANASKVSGEDAKGVEIILFIMVMIYGYMITF